MASFIKHFMTLSFSFAVLLGASQAHAQIRPGAGRPEVGGQVSEERLRLIETRILQLESTVSNLSQRLASVESQQRPQPYNPPAPAAPSEIACMQTDTFNGAVYLGTGRSILEAKAAAADSCSKSYNPTYCQKEPKCTDGRDNQVRQGAICILRDTFNGKTYKGEGKGFISAEFNARKSCAASYNASYCQAAVSCEAF